MNVLTEAELAQTLSLPVAKVAELRQKKKWPHLRLTRFDVRYTEQQVDQILARHAVVGEQPAPGGLTVRSASRLSVAKVGSR